MRTLVYTLLFFAFTTSAIAQVKEFGKNDHTMRITEGDQVNVKADTAFIISKERAKDLNRELDLLDSIESKYNEVLDDRDTLMMEINRTRDILEKLQKKMEKDSAFANEELSSILADLKKTLDEMKATNKRLEDENKDLKKQINGLRKIADELEEVTRGIWWNGITDKIVSFASGLGVGILIGAVLL